MGEGTNGKAVDIARLEERLKALKEDVEEWKKDEKEEGQRASKQRNELYDKCDDITKQIGKVYTKISETSAKSKIIQVLVLATISAGIGAIFKYVM